jgi:hypothetical protein
MTDIYMYPLADLTRARSEPASTPTDFSRRYARHVVLSRNWNIRLSFQNIGLESRRRLTDIAHLAEHF